LSDVDEQQDVLGDTVLSDEVNVISCIFHLQYYDIAHISQVSTILYSSYHLATCACYTAAACNTETN